MSNTGNARRNLEKPVIDLFEAVARQYPGDIKRGQSKENQVPGTQFQFGDLRVNAPSCYILIEVESAGGVTNLVKYWYCLEEHKISQPIRLLHIYSLVTDESWKSHLDLWRSLSGKMKAALGNMFVTTDEPYTYKTAEDLDGIVKDFDRILKEEFIGNQGK